MCDWMPARRRPIFRIWALALPLPFRRVGLAGNIKNNGPGLIEPITLR